MVEPLSPSLLQGLDVRAVEEQLNELESSLIDFDTSRMDDYFDSFLSASSPHPSVRSLIGAGDGPAASPSSSSALPTSTEQRPCTPIFLPPLSPATPLLSEESAVPSPLSSPSAFSLASSPSPSPQPPSSRRSAGKRRPSASSSIVSKRLKRRQSSSSSASESSDSGCDPSSSAVWESMASLDPVTAKKERRKMQNRNAAATSRQKKQRYMTEMETRIAKLMLEQTQLLQDVQALQQENVQLKQRVLQKTSQAPVKVEVPEVAVQEVKAEVTAEVVEGQKVKTERVEREHVSLGHAPNAQPSLVSTVEDTPHSVDLSLPSAFPPSPHPLPLHHLDAPPHSLLTDSHSPLHLSSSHAPLLPYLDLDSQDPAYDDLFPHLTAQSDDSSMWMDSLVV